ncbi:MAG: cobalt-precorrin 5A hydrolase [Desulfamplus sp.]|nr:cobalt-precorrin 5A hydrolase [Desulfamplus sp.]
MTKKICIWAITPGGVKIGQKLGLSIPDCDFLVSQTIADSLVVPGDTVVFEKLSVMFSKLFRKYCAHICIFSTAIAVRMAAPLLESKLVDPAIVVIDDRGVHAISLLSGHLGGGNQLALDVARITGATPVITTATDINHLPSIDMVAKKENLLIQNPEMIRKVNMAFLQDKKIRILDPLNIVTPHIPEQFRWSESCPNSYVATVICSDMERPEAGVAKISLYNGRVGEAVPRETLILRPASLMAGMGCNKGTTVEELLEFLTTAFEENNLCLNSLAGIATTSVKQDETGLLELAQRLGKPILFYDKAALNSVETIENPSDMVEKHLGVKSVCEAASILAAHNGNLIVPKIKRGNATLAVARIEKKKNRI